MCGIVGYVGDQQARDVVIEGLRRLEYRGYDSAGIALVARRRASSRDKRAGKLANLEKAHRGDTRCRRRRPASGTPAGPPTAPPTTSTPTRTSASTAGSPSCTTASSRTSPRCATSSSGPATTCAPRPTPRSPPTCSRASSTRAATSPTAMQQVCRRLEGAFTLVAVDAQDPDRVVAARRNSPLVVGLGEGENFLGSDVAAFIEHTREALELGQDQVVTITRDDVAVTDFDGKPAEGRRYHVDWDLSAAEKDGFDWFMRKEIFEQPRARRRRAARPARRRGRAAARRGADHRGRAARHRQDRHHRLRHGATTPAWSRSTPSSTGPGSRARSSSPTSSATATRS